MYGKITENSIRISKEKLEGYKPIVEERPITGGGVFKEYVDRGDCIARVYEKRETSNINARLNALEERQNKSEEKQSITDGAIEELASLMSEVVSNG